jgi:hypothetical protein
MAAEIEKLIRQSAGLIVDKMLQAAPEGDEAAEADQGPDEDGVLPDVADGASKGVRARR